MGGEANPFFSSVGVQTHIFSENTPKTRNFSRHLGYKDGDVTATGDSRERGSPRQILGTQAQFYQGERSRDDTALEFCSWIQSQ